MERYPVTWSPYMGQAAGDVVCEGGVCKITPVGAPAPAPALMPSPPLMPAAPEPASSGISLPWLAVGAAAGVGLIILALR